jgi:hypothetical protein
MGMNRTEGAADNRLAIAAIASAAAGVLHAAAAGIHAEHPELARVFVVLAVGQMGAAVWGFVRPGRFAAAALAAVNAIALVGWVATRLTGISWIDGLESAERPQPADTIAAVFAAVALLMAVVALARRMPAIPSHRVTVVAVAAGVLVIPGLVNATNHDHGGHDHAVSESGEVVHVHGDENVAAASAAAAGVGAAESTASNEHAHSHAAPEGTGAPSATHGPVVSAPVPDGTADAVAPQPYDPTLPIDLGGVPGVTPQQQAFAENLVASTVRDLPQWSDLAVVEAAGFHSIGDAITGHEHYVQWDWIDDDVWLDPDHPESLVFEPQPDGSKKLVSAMFMLPGGYPLEDVPDWGGALMQWHVHGDLCFTDDPVAPQVAGLKPIGASCQPPLVNFLLSPMIHVWITPTPCGPFAALEGIGGGQVPEGEDVLCDHVHGAP